MKGYKNAKLLARCLARIADREVNIIECTDQYPQIAEELRLALHMKTLGNRETETWEEVKQKKLIKARVMGNLPDRKAVVTKPIKRRYTGQNLKRRFAMSWIIILTTIISLVSGGGIVYASGNTLPGDVLYPVKTWVEDVRLVVANDAADVGLHFRFAETRIEEIASLMEEDELDEIDTAFDGFENHARLLYQVMAKIQAEDPEEAIRLRTELETKLQEQAHRVADMLEIPENSGDQIQDRIREMLQTNTQLRERIQEADDEPVIEEVQSDGEESVEVEGAIETTDGNDNGKKSNGGEISGNIDAAQNTFKFRLGGQGANGVFAVISGTRYACEVANDEAVCDATGAPNEGSVELYDAQTNQLLFTFSYEHEFAFNHGWQGEKNDNGNSGTGGDGGTAEKETNQNNNGN